MRIIKKISFLFVICCSLTTYGQDPNGGVTTAPSQTNPWYFGEYASIDFNNTDVDGYPQSYTQFLEGGFQPPERGLTASEATSVIRNEDGDVLFYTNGAFIYDKIGQNIIPNNQTLFPSVPASSISAPYVIKDGVSQDQVSNVSYYSHTTTHIVPFVNDENKYYVISSYPREIVGNASPVSSGQAYPDYYSGASIGLRYAIVDINNGSPSLLNLSTTGGQEYSKEITYDAKLLLKNHSDPSVDFLYNKSLISENQNQIPFRIRLQEGFAVIPSKNGKGYWIVTPVQSSGIIISRYLSDTDQNGGIGLDIKLNGDEVFPVVNAVDPNNNEINAGRVVDGNTSNKPVVQNWMFFGGQANDGVTICKPNKAGNKIALTAYGLDYFTESGSGQDNWHLKKPRPEVYLFDFNSFTGKVTKDKVFDLSNETNPVFPYGVEFSSNGKFLYFSGFDAATYSSVQPTSNNDNGSFSYSLANGVAGTGIYGTKLYMVDVDKKTLHKSSIELKSPGQLQIGPDNRIYMAHKLFPSLSVIDNPDEGKLSNLVKYEISLAGHRTTYAKSGLPSTVHLRKKATCGNNGSLLLEYGINQRVESGNSGPLDFHTKFTERGSSIHISNNGWIGDDKEVFFEDVTSQSDDVLRVDDIDRANGFWCVSNNSTEEGFIDVQFELANLLTDEEDRRNYDQYVILIERPKGVIEVNSFDGKDVQDPISGILELKQLKLLPGYTRISIGKYATSVSDSHSKIRPSETTFRERFSRGGSTLPQNTLGVDFGESRNNALYKSWYQTEKGMYWYAYKYEYEITDNGEIRHVVTQDPNSTDYEWGSDIDYLDHNRGYIYIPETRTYSFSLSADDASRFHIKDKDGVIREFGFSNITEVPNSRGNGVNWFTNKLEVELTRGYHKFDLYHKEGGGLDFIVLGWGEKPTNYNGNLTHFQIPHSMLSVRENHYDVATLGGFANGDKLVDSSGVTALYSDSPFEANDMSLVITTEKGSIEQGGLIQFGHNEGGVTNLITVQGATFKKIDRSWEVKFSNISKDIPVSLDFNALEFPTSSSNYVALISTSPDFIPSTTRVIGLDDKQKGQATLTGDCYITFGINNFLCYAATTSEYTTIGYGGIKGYESGTSNILTVKHDKAILTDEFLIFGHNNGALTYEATNQRHAVNVKRLERTWCAQLIAKKGREIQFEVSQADIDQYLVSMPAYAVPVLIVENSSFVTDGKAKTIRLKLDGSTYSTDPFLIHNDDKITLGYLHDYTNITYATDVRGLGKTFMGYNSKSLTSGGLWFGNATEQETDDFIVVGHNNSSLSINGFLSQLPTGVSSRTNRVWFVNQYETPGEFNVSIDYNITSSSADFPISSQGQYYVLMVSDDASDFTNAKVYPLYAKEDGAVTHFQGSNVTFTDGQYLAIGFGTHIKTDKVVYCSVTGEEIEAGTNTNCKLIPFDIQNFSLASSNPCKPEISKATLQLGADFGEEFKFGKRAVQAKVVVELIAKNEAGAILTSFDGYKNQEFTINTNDVASQLFIDITLPYLEEGNNKIKTIEVKAISLEYSSDGVDAELLADLRLFSSLKVDRKIRVNEPKHPVLAQHTPTISTQGHDYTFSWDNNVCEAPLYQFQLLKLYNKDENLANSNSEEQVSATIDWSEALTIEVTSNSLKLFMAEGEGYYTWRVRPVGDYYSNGTGNRRNWGAWSTNPHKNGDVVSYSSKSAVVSPHDVYFSQVEEGTNFIYSRVFTEGGKTSESIVYANGLQQAQQSQTRLESNGTDKQIVASQSVYDYNGRPTLSVLPAPVSDHNEFIYRKGMLTVLDANSIEIPYRAEHFDKDINYNKPTTATGGKILDYYDKSEDLTIPSSEGKPFARTVFFNDGTDRPEEAGGVGEELGIEKGHTTRMKYAQATDDELIRIFGNQAPSAKHVYKVFTTDANNITSIQYVNSKGQTLATALGLNDTDKLPTNLTPLASEASTALGGKDEPLFGIYQSIPSTISGDKMLSSATSTVIFTKPNQTLSVDYSVTPAIVKDACGSYCQECSYDLYLSVKEAGATTPLKEVTQKIEGADLLDNGNCTATKVIIPQIKLQNLEEKTYIITKTLTLNTEARDAFASEVETGVKDQINAKIADLKTFLEEMKTGQVDGQVSLKTLDDFLDEIVALQTDAKAATDFELLINNLDDQTVTVFTSEANTVGINTDVLTKDELKLIGQKLEIKLKTTCCSITIPVLLPIPNPCTSPLTSEQEYPFEKGLIDEIGKTGINTIEDIHATSDIKFSIDYHYVPDDDVTSEFTYSTGDFNTLVTSMIADGYSCDALWEATKMLAVEYNNTIPEGTNGGDDNDDQKVSVSDLTKQAAADDGSPDWTSTLVDKLPTEVNLLERFLGHTGYKIEGVIDPSQTNSSVYTYLKTRPYKYFAYASSYAKEIPVQGGGGLKSNSFLSIQNGFCTSEDVDVVDVGNSVNELDLTEYIKGNETPEFLSNLTDAEFCKVTRCTYEYTETNGITKLKIQDASNSFDEETYNNFYLALQSLTGAEDRIDLKLDIADFEAQAAEMVEKCKKACDDNREAFLFDLDLLHNVGIDPITEKYLYEDYQGNPITYADLCCTAQMLVEQSQERCKFTLQKAMCNEKEKVMSIGTKEEIAYMQRVTSGDFKLVKPINNAPIILAEPSEVTYALHGAINELLKNNVTAYIHNGVKLDEYYDLDKLTAYNKYPNVFKKHNYKYIRVNTNGDITLSEDKLTGFTLDFFINSYITSTSNWDAFNGFTTEFDIQGDFVELKPQFRDLSLSTSLTSKSTVQLTSNESLPLVYTEQIATSGEVRDGYVKIEEDISSDYVPTCTDYRGNQADFGTLTKSFNFIYKNGTPLVTKELSDGNIMIVERVIEDGQNVIYARILDYKDGAVLESSSRLLNTDNCLATPCLPGSTASCYQCPDFEITDFVERKSFGKKPVYYLVGNVHDLNGPDQVIVIKLDDQLNKINEYELVTAGLRPVRVGIVQNQLVTVQLGQTTNSSKYNHATAILFAYDLGDLSLKWGRQVGALANLSISLDTMSNSYAGIVFEKQSVYVLEALHDYKNDNSFVKVCEVAGDGTVSWVKRYDLEVPYIIDEQFDLVDAKRVIYNQENYYPFTGNYLTKLGDKLVVNGINSHYDTREVYQENLVLNLQGVEEERFVATTRTEKARWISEDDLYARFSYIPLVIGGQSSILTRSFSTLGEDSDFTSHSSMFLDQLTAYRFYYEPVENGLGLFASRNLVGQDGIEGISYCSATYVSSDGTSGQTASCNVQPTGIRWVPSYASPVVTGNTTQTIKQLEKKAAEKALVALESSIQTCAFRLGAALKKQYETTCVPKADELLSYERGEELHHYTLFYYDRAGNLISTVPPAGVDNVNLKLLDQDPKEGKLRNDKAKTNHTLVTSYYYNSLGQLVEQNTPDGGTTKFIYNTDGLLRFSQDPVQAERGKVSYSKYDALGRVIEVGEFSVWQNDKIFTEKEYYLGELDRSTTTLDASFLDRLNKYGELSFPSTGHFSTKRTLSEVVHTVYSDAAPVSYKEQTQRFLRNRISHVYREVAPSFGSALEEVAHTYYSYDPHGNVEWMIQEIPGIGQHTIAYEYDLISGNVLKVSYDEGKPGQFYHRYKYDADNRIIAVETSNNGCTWEEDAHYEYYAHGPLRRSEIGEEKVQGCDFVYNINGWLKAINDPSLGISNDPGADGETTARDAFGMLLQYHNNDFKKSYNAISSRYNSDDSEMLGTASKPLYNGNIASWTVNNQDEKFGFENRAGRTFEYDYLNRILSSNFQEYDQGTWQTNTTNDFNTSYAYDANGNITGLKRYAKGDVGNKPGQANMMDEFTYNYNRRADDGKITSNQLTHVSDVIVTDREDDIEGTNSYIYDAEGKLVTDASQGITLIEWNTLNKVKKIYKDDGQDVSFTYDAMGNRVSKSVDNIDAETSVVTTTTTYYVADASGNSMALYTKEVSNENANTNTRYTLEEQAVYGSDRVGLYKPIGVTLDETTTATGSANIVSTTRRLGRKYYELKDHLGNVRVVVTDRKLPTTTSGTTDPVVTVSPVTKSQNFNGLGLYSTNPESSQIEIADVHQGANVSAEINAWVPANVSLSDVGIKVYSYDANGNEIGQAEYVDMSGVTLSTRHTYATVTLNTTITEANADHIGVSLVGKSAFQSYFNTLSVTADQTSVTTGGTGTTAQTETYTESFENDERKFAGGSQYVTDQMYSASLIKQAGVTSHYTNGYAYAAVEGADVIFTAKYKPSAVVDQTKHYLKVYELDVNGTKLKESNLVHGGLQTGVWNDVSTTYTVTNPATVEVKVVFYNEESWQSYVDEMTVTVSSPSTVEPVDVDGTWVADVVSYNDYYPFGSPMPERSFSSPSYRYGFQGQEKDDEVKGAGLSINYKYRMHDPRLGRFFAVDPLASKYPFYSSYAFSGNRVVDSRELEGLEPKSVINSDMKFTKPAIRLLSLVSGVSESRIGEATVGETDALILYEFNGGGAVTFKNIYYTDHYFNGGSADNLFSWLHITSHEVGHFPQFDAENRKVGRYIFEHAREYTKGHDGSKLEIAADRGQHNFESFYGYIGWRNIKNVFLSKSMTDDQKVSAITKYYRKYINHKIKDLENQQIAVLDSWVNGDINDSDKEAIISNMDEHLKILYEESRKLESYETEE